jgi:hypothetical protein
MGAGDKKVSPEFDKLADSRVAVLVWTDQATLFDYRHARLELATYIADKLSAETAQRDMKTDVVDPRDVEDFIQKNLDAQIDPSLVGRRFKADYVIYLEILEFQFRDPKQPQFLQGRISASVAVYDLRASGNRPPRVVLSSVACRHPDGPPLLMTASNQSLLREATYRQFAEEVARKFYEHTIAL